MKHKKTYKQYHDISKEIVKQRKEFEKYFLGIIKENFDQINDNEMEETGSKLTFKKSAVPRSNSS